MGNYTSARAQMAMGVGLGLLLGALLVFVILLGAFLSSVRLDMFPG